MSLKKSASEFIINSIDKSGKIKNANLQKDIFETINSLAYLNEMELAQKCLNKYISYQQRSGEFYIKEKDMKVSPVYFLKSISLYMQKKPDIKKFIKSIKKSLKYIENHFDNEYLLIFDSDDKNNKMFSANENAEFLSFCDDLIELFNTFDYNKEADSIFMLKSKIELGFSRYFIHKKSNSFVKYFKVQTKEFFLCSEIEILDILNKFNVDEKIHITMVNKLKNQLKTENETNNFLSILFGMKKIQDKSYEKTLKKYEKYLCEFPELIINTSKRKINFEIEKSLFKDFSPKIKEFKKEKVTVVNPGQLNIANKILKLLQEK